MYKWFVNLMYSMVVKHNYRFRANINKRQRQKPEVQAEVKNRANNPTSKQYNEINQKRETNNETKLRPE